MKLFTRAYTRSRWYTIVSNGLFIIVNNLGTKFRVHFFGSLLTVGHPLFQVECVITIVREPVPSYKELAELLKDGFTPEAQEKIMEMRQTLLALQQENAQLQQRIRELETSAPSAASPIEKLIYDKGVYWTLDRGTRQGPYCPACQDRAGKLVRLHYQHTGTPGVYWVCKACHQEW